MISTTSRAGSSPCYASAAATIAGTSELGRRDVDRDGPRLRPSHRRRAGSVDHPLPDLPDEVGLFRHRDELPREMKPRSGCCQGVVQGEVADTRIVAPAVGEVA